VGGSGGTQATTAAAAAAAPAPRILPYDEAKVLHPIYQSIDAHQYKAALRGLNSCIERFGPDAIFLSLKAYAENRSGDLAASLETFESATSQPLVQRINVRALNMYLLTFRARPECLQKIADILEALYKASPKDESIGAQLLKTLCSTRNFARQQSLASSLYNTTKNEMYLLWSAAAALAHFRRPGPHNKMLAVPDTLMSRFYDTPITAGAETFFRPVPISAVVLRIRLAMQMGFTADNARRAIELLNKPHVAKAVEQEGSKVELLPLKVQLMLIAGQIEEALQELKRAAELHPDDWRILVTAIYLYLWQRTDALIPPPPGCLTAYGALDGLSSNDYQTAGSILRSLLMARAQTKDKAPAAQLRESDIEPLVSWIRKLTTSKAANEYQAVLRGPYVALVHIQEQLLRLNMPSICLSTAPAVAPALHYAASAGLVRELIRYFTLVGDRPSFADDIASALEVLPPTISRAAFEGYVVAPLKRDVVEQKSKRADNSIAPIQENLAAAVEAALDATIDLKARLFTTGGADASGSTDEDTTPEAAAAATASTTQVLLAIWTSIINALASQDSSPKGAAATLQRQSNVLTVMRALNVNVPGTTAKLAPEAHQKALLASAYAEFEQYLGFHGIGPTNVPSINPATLTEARQVFDKTALAEEKKAQQASSKNKKGKKPNEPGQPISRSEAGDRHLVLAVHDLVDAASIAFVHATDSKNLLPAATCLWQAVLILELALQFSPFNFEFKLWLIRLYLHPEISVYKRAKTLWAELSVKQIQVMTLTHFILADAIRFGDFQFVQSLTNAVSSFHATYVAEAGDLYHTAFQQKNYDAIYDFNNFGDRLERSRQRFVCAAEQAHAEIVTAGLQLEFTPPSDAASSATALPTTGKAVYEASKAAADRLASIFSAMRVAAWKEAGVKTPNDATASFIDSLAKAVRGMEADSKLDDLKESEEVHVKAPYQALKDCLESANSNVQEEKSEALLVAADPDKDSVAATLNYLHETDDYTALRVYCAKYLPSSTASRISSMVQLSPKHLNLLTGTLYCFGAARQSQLNRPSPSVYVDAFHIPRKAAGPMPISAIEQAVALAPSAPGSDALALEPLVIDPVQSSQLSNIYYYPSTSATNALRLRAIVPSMIQDAFELASESLRLRIGVLNHHLEALGLLDEPTSATNPEALPNASTLCDKVEKLNWRLILDTFELTALIAEASRLTKFRMLAQGEDIPTLHDVRLTELWSRVESALSVMRLHVEDLTSALSHLFMSGPHWSSHMPTCESDAAAVSPRVLLHTGALVNGGSYFLVAQLAQAWVSAAFSRAAWQKLGTVQPNTEESEDTVLASLDSVRQGLMNFLKCVLQCLVGLSDALDSYRVPVRVGLQSLEETLTGGNQFKDILFAAGAAVPYFSSPIVVDKFVLPLLQFRRDANQELASDLVKRVDQLGAQIRALGVAE